MKNTNDIILVRPMAIFIKRIQSTTLDMLPRYEEEPLSGVADCTSEGVL